jgi:hypothetical protein
MTDARLQTLIEKAFEERAKITPATTSDVRDTVGAVLHDAKARGKTISGERVSDVERWEFLEITIVRVERADAVLKQDRCDMRVGDEVPAHRRVARHMLKRVHESV